MIYEKGEMVCLDCGLVLEERIIDPSPEYRAYNQEQKNSRERIGSPLTNLRHDYGMSTEVTVSSKDAHGKALSQERINQLRKFKWLQKRENKSTARNLKKAIHEIKRITAELELPPAVAETAGMLYRKVLKADLVRGRSIKCMVAPTIYLAARKMNVPITIKDLEVASMENKKAIARSFRIIISELDIKPDPFDPKKLISRLSSELKITPQTQQVALQLLLEVVKNKMHTGKTPMSIAGAAIYIACLQTGERRTQQMVAKAAKTTPVTLRNRVKELMTLIDTEITIKRGAAATPVYFKNPWEF